MVLLFFSQALSKCQEASRADGRGETGGETAVFSGQSTLDFVGPQNGFGYDAEGREQHPRVKAREEQDPIWDLGRASCPLAVGRKRKRNRAWE